jgi:hypothetical protein
MNTRFIFYEEVVMQKINCTPNFSLAGIFFLFFSLIFCEKSLSQTSSIYFPSYPIRSFPTNGATTGIVLQDFNGDGKVDIAVSELISSTVSILINETNNNNILFAPYVSFPVGWEPTTLVSADFDGDGKFDIVTSNQGSGDLTYLRNVSANGVIAFQKSNGPDLRTMYLFLISADFNKDGRMDLAVANTASDTIYIFKNTSTPGNINFTVETEFYVNMSFSETLAAVDFDGDGKLDLATFGNTESLGSTGFLVYPNNSSATKIEFNTPYKLQRVGWDKFVCGDFNEDTKTDVAFLGTNGINFIWNKSTPGNFSFEHLWILDYGLGWGKCIYSTDINNDSLLDLLVSVPLVYSAEPETHNYLHLLVNKSSNGNIQFDPYISFGVAEDPMLILSSDLDNDGKNDLIIGTDDAPCVSIMHNISSSSIVKLNSASIFKVAFPKGPTSQWGDWAYGFTINGADFDGDNKTDLVSASWDDNSMIILQNTSSPGNINFVNVAGYPTQKKPNAVVVADFNNDSKKDIIIGNQNEGVQPYYHKGSLSIFTNKSTIGHFDFSSDSLSLNNSPLSLASGDFDKDGRIDLLVGPDKGVEEGFPIILKNTTINGKILFEQAWTSNVNFQSVSIHSVDLNNDGLLDILVGDESYNKVFFFMNTSNAGALSFSDPGIIDYSLSLIESVKISDLDGDGLCDLVVASQSYPGGCTIFKNISSQSTIMFSDPIVYLPLSHPSSIHITDLTNDGKPEIIVGDPFSQTTILENKSSVGNILFTPAFPGALILGDIKGDYNYYTADFDGDGFKDIAAPRSDQNEIWILRTSTNSLTSIEEYSPSLPDEFILDQNFPNPFNPSTQISFSILKTANVSLIVYDIMGREVVELINERKAVGRYYVIFDGKQIAGGTYFYKLKTNNYSQTRKMILLR